MCKVTRAVSFLTIARKRVTGPWQTASSAPSQGHPTVNKKGVLAMWPFQATKQTPVTADAALPGRDASIPTADKHFINGHPIQGPFPAGLETAMFGLGCFWGAERLFWEIPGVYTTAVGYAAGLTKNPTYEEETRRETERQVRHARKRLAVKNGDDSDLQGRDTP